VGTYSDIRDQRYRTELDIGLKRVESDIVSDIGINLCPICDVRHPDIHRSAQWLRGKVLASYYKGLSSNQAEVKNIF
jgi:hypothetical protein